MIRFSRWTLLCWLLVGIAGPAALSTAAGPSQTQKVTTQHSNVTVDADTGPGTQTVTLFGIALPASGGAVIGGTATNPFIVNPGSGTFLVGDGSGPLTIDGTVSAAQSGTWTIQPGNTANTTPWLMSIAQGGNTALVNASGQLSMNCANCSGSGVSQQDNTGFTAGTSNMVPMAGFVGSTSVTAGNAGALQMTGDRNLFVNLNKVGGTALALGQTTMSASLPVAIASNQSALTVTANAGTGDFLSVAAHTMNEALKEANAIGGQLDDTSPTAATEDNIAPLRITAQRAGHVNLRNNAGTEMGTSSNPLEVHVRSTSVGSTSENDDGSLATGVTGMSEMIAKSYAMDSQAAAWTRFTHQLLDFDSGAGTENLSVIGIALPGSGGPVAGGTAANPFTVALSATSAVNIKSADVNVGGPLTAAGQFISLQVGVAGGSMYGSAAVQITGTWVGTLSFEGNVDLSNYVPLEAYPVDGGAGVMATTGNGIWMIPTAGLKSIRVYGTALSSGTATVTIEATALDTRPLRSTTPIGTVAHDAVDSGNPLKIGAKASNALSGLTLVANADRTDLFAGLDGVLITRPHANLEDRVSGVGVITDGSSTSVVAAQGAGVRFCATTIIISNSSATNVTVDLRDGTAGAVLATLPAKADMGGAVVPLQTPLCTTANTAFAADPSAAASTVAVTAVGFKTKL